ncbi:putative PLAC8 motif-containing protein [Rosa chinensis]|uniref:Putative PLAC8 motif-containing protein n=1 Tax=Rosa chinensis TaxID=74649 RepID=A0A2P6QR87_ROSCH|nr:putative PLAC8 motif-containing protein [Rosa chinensis]
MTIFNLVKSEWSVGLCHCYKDIPTCCITCLLPCVTFGRIAEIVDKGRSCCVYGLLMMVQCQWLYSCIYREKLRKKFCLADQPCCELACISAANYVPFVKSTPSSKLKVLIPPKVYMCNSSLINIPL